jgi:long-chain acyl-CoA synthetase
VNLANIINDHPADAPALVSRGRTTDFGTLREQVAAVRGGLVGLGLEPGERLAILAGNNWYFVVSYLAGLGAGLVVVPLNPTDPSSVVARELAAVEAAAAVVGPAARDAFSAIDRAALPALRHVVTTGSPVDGGIELGDLLGSDPAPVVDRAPEDLAVLMFTSGTAGSPRAAMLTHANLYANIRQSEAATPELQPSADVGFGVLPLFHIFGLNVVLGLSLHLGSCIVLIERFDPLSALETIPKYGITTISGPPTMWAAFAGVPGVASDLFSGVRLAMSGAAKLPVEVGQAMEARFGVRLNEGYGLTEASPVVCAPSGLDVPPGSVGIPVPGVEVRLVDPDGNDVLVGDAGELLVRGPNVFAGYWRDPEATSRVLTEDGWLRTGDIAVVDDEGFIYLVDRAKDLIIVSGFNVFPAEVEEVLLEHPAVEACAVVGVPHPYTGEAVKAFVQSRPGVSVEEDDVIAFCGERLARYKCPNKVAFVEEIPRGLGGKILRRALR